MNGESKCFRAVGLILVSILLNQSQISLFCSLQANKTYADKIQIGRFDFWQFRLQTIDPFRFRNDQPVEKLVVFENLHMPWKLKEQKENEKNINKYDENKQVINGKRREGDETHGLPRRNFFTHESGEPEITQLNDLVPCQQNVFGLHVPKLRVNPERTCSFEESNMNPSEAFYKKADHRLIYPVINVYSGLAAQRIALPRDKFYIGIHKGVLRYKLDNSITTQDNDSKENMRRSTKP
uniref:Uncharacterized protein n=1 Tax=Romanomermis culicivorax TaxID=13658 RepID=A0A915HZB1_ROMCU